MSQTREIFLYALLAVLIGTAASVAANLFVQGGAIFIWLSEILRSVVSAASFDYAPLVKALCLSIGALLIYQIRRRFGVTKWSGPAESMFALQYRAGPPLNTRIGAGSVFAAFVACGCGAPVGQYGPVIHLGATLSQALRNRIRRPLRPDIMLACGISGGITGAFNAPFAAAAFVFEVMLRRYSAPVFGAVVLAAGSAYVVHEALFDHRLFLALAISQPTLEAGILASLIAPLCALIAWCYIRSLHTMQAWSSKSTLSPGVKIAACALACRRRVLVVLGRSRHPSLQRRSRLLVVNHKTNIVMAASRRGNATTAVVEGARAVMIPQLAGGRQGASL